MDITKEEIIEKFLSLIPKDKRNNKEAIETAIYFASIIFANKKHKWTFNGWRYVCTECNMKGDQSSSDINIIEGEEDISCAEKMVRDILL